MAQGISPNPLNDISKVYLDLVSKINKDEEDKIIQKWDDTSVNKVDPDLVLSVDSTVQKEGKLTSVKATTYGMSHKERQVLIDKERERQGVKPKPTKEEFSNWRDDLREVVAEPEEKAEKEVTEKKGIKNKVVINPKLGEAVAEMGGQLLEIKQLDNPNVVDPAERKEDPGLKSKESRQKMLKKQVLLKKLQAVRQGAGGDITASYDLIDAATDYLYEEGLNEEGIDLLIEEIGLDGFVEFIEGPIVELNEAEEGRPARKASVRAKSYEKVKAEVDKSDAAKKKAKKGEYAPSYAKKETDVTVYDDDKPAAKKKAPAKKPVAKKPAPKPVAKKASPKPVAKKAAPKTKGGAIVKAKSSAIVKRAVTKAKIKQPVKKATKQGLRDKIATAYKKGVERHKASVGKAKTEVGKVVKTAKTTAKQHSQHRKDFVKGISPTAKEKKIAKGVGGAVKKALTREELELLEKVKGQDTEMRKAASAERRSGETKRLSPSKGRANVGKMVRDIRFYDKKTKETKPSVVGMVTDEVVLEKDLNAAERRALPDKEFALPGKGKGPEGKQAGSYPIPDKTHARMALAMVAKHGTPEKKAKVRAAVAKKFPGIKQEEVVHEAQSSYDKARKAAARRAANRNAERRAGTRGGNMERETYTSEAGARMHYKGYRAKANEEVQLEAKVDTGSAEAKASARNKRNTPAGKDSKFDTSVFITRKPGESLDSARTRKRRDAHAAKRGVKEDKAFDNVVAALRKKHGEGSVLTKDSPKPKPQPRPKAKPDTRTPEQKKKDQDHANVMARYGGEDNYKKGRGLGT